VVLNVGVDEQLHGFQPSWNSTSASSSLFTSLVVGIPPSIASTSTGGTVTFSISAGTTSILLVTGARISIASPRSAASTDYFDFEVIFMIVVKGWFAFIKVLLRSRRIAVFISGEVISTLPRLAIPSASATASTTAARS